MSSIIIWRYWIDIHLEYILADVNLPHGLQNSSFQKWKSMRCICYAGDFCRLCLLYLVIIFQLSWSVIGIPSILSIKMDKQMNWMQVWVEVFLSKYTFVFSVAVQHASMADKTYPRTSQEDIFFDAFNYILYWRADQRAQSGSWPLITQGLYRLLPHRNGQGMSAPVVVIVSHICPPDSLISRYKFNVT